MAATALGAAMTFLALLIAVANISLASRSAAARRGVPRNHISPVVLLATILATLGGLLSYGCRPLALLGLLTLALDTGGSVWLLVTVCRNAWLLSPDGLPPGDSNKRA
jgi:hypothetical protein